MLAVGSARTRQYTVMTTEEQLEGLREILSHLMDEVLPEIERDIIDLQERLAAQEDEPFLTVDDVPYMQTQLTKDQIYLEYPKDE